MTPKLIQNLNEKNVRLKFVQNLKESMRRRNWSSKPEEDPVHPVKCLSCLDVIWRKEKDGKSNTEPDDVSCHLFYHHHKHHNQRHHHGKMANRWQERSHIIWQMMFPVIYFIIINIVKINIIIMNRWQYRARWCWDWRRGRSRWQEVSANLVWNGYYWNILKY